MTTYDKAVALVNRQVDSRPDRADMERLRILDEYRQWRLSRVPHDEREARAWLGSEQRIERAKDIAKDIEAHNRRESDKRLARWRQIRQSARQAEDTNRRESARRMARWDKLFMDTKVADFERQQATEAALKPYEAKAELLALEMKVAAMRQE